MVTALLAGCLFMSGDDPSPPTDPVAGGGTRTTNGDVAGRVKFPDASPAEGVQIRLYKVFLGEKVEPYSAEWAGISDSLGRFTFQNVRVGTFAMSVVDRIAGTRAIMPRLSKGTEGFFVLDAVLSPWVTLKGRVFPSNGGSPENIRVCIPGLPECVTPGPDSVYTLHQAPQGNYDLVFLCDSLAAYLPIRASMTDKDTLYLKDIELDVTQAVVSQPISIYETEAAKSVYALPKSYAPNARPDWYAGKEFDRVQYYSPDENRPFQLWDSEDYRNWQYFRTLNLPLDIPESTTHTPLVDFPYYLRLTQADLDFSQAAKGGSDLRISREDGRQLSYYIVKWDSAAGLAELWVNLDTLRKAETAPRLSLHWGNPDAGGLSNPMAALGRVEEGRQIWPLDDNAPSSLVRDLRGTHPGYLTRLGLGKDETAKHAVAGVMGGALLLDGIENQITIDPHPSIDYTKLTLSVWARNNNSSLSEQQYIVLKGEPGRKQWHLALDQARQVRFGMAGTNGKLTGAWYSKQQVKIDQWHLYTITFEGGVVRAYLDGEEMAAGKGTGTLPKSIPTLNSPIMLGQRIAEREQFWSGEIDNLMLEGEVRSPEWIRLLYQSQKPNP